MPTLLAINQFAFLISLLIRGWHVGTVQAWIRLCVYLEMLVLIFSQAFKI